MTDQGDDVERDDRIERIAAALQPLPAVDAEAKARVLVAVAAERARSVALPDRGRAARRIVAAGLLAAGVVSAALWLPRGGQAPAVAPGANRAAPAAPAPAALANAAPDAATAVQLVVRAPGATRVAVVGDFTDWEQDRVAMTRDAESGLWSATVLVRPGRHVYAFVADDTLWMRDPRAPVATDPDFGRPGSLLLVGRP